MVRFDWETQAYALILKESPGKEGWSTGKVVAIQPQMLQFRQLAQFSRNGTWGIHNSVKTCKNQVTLSYWYDFTMYDFTEKEGGHKEGKFHLSYWKIVEGENTLDDNRW
jgi:hypothetical protein